MRKRILTGLAALVALTVIGSMGLLYLALHRVQGNFFDSDGAQIHYTDQGKGEPVILVHGYAANAELNWRLNGIIPRLENNFRVIAMDVRGHGLSDTPPAPDKFGMELVHDVRRLMDHLDIEKAHLVGYSMGGIITYKFMAVYPERLLSAMPCGAAWMQPGSDLCTLAQRIYSGLEGRSQALPEKSRWISFVERSAVGLVNDMDGLKYVADSFSELAVTADEFRNVNVPMLALKAEHEELVLGGGNLEGVLSGFKETLLPRGLHSTVIFYPEFSDAMEAFLMSQRTTNPPD